MNLADYITKSDIKKKTGIETSNLAAKSGLSAPVDLYKQDNIVNII